MHKLRKKTEILLRRVDQQVRVILEPEFGAPEDTIRRVSVVVPSSPQVMVAADQLPADIGYNREYKLPVITPGQQCIFDLMPDQFLISVANESLAELTLIVQYLKDGE